ncbi:sulfite exporter TauE/SafE family protein [Vulcanisaeta souniana]|uniref:Probable membrane transporter protein n=1 Tax=Vulcanisaeta souniana JCM 11219 TaxID=1293586 RepID=A0A830E361_9CREN|nr:sulfite exporter TauE/SafE family protein [Vulcanisaeta souniana]BDR93170.1 anion permease [Vulcanisaeta souniana JCM 11219]GGI78199.1 anion permease [Vulcanisaeta souniana JCM 11219]
MSINLPQLIELFMAALAISFITSQGGISGAYLLLPIQSCILNTVNPVISGTNLLYNLISIPLSIHEYFRERRIAASFTSILVIGASAGAVVGTWLRGHYLTGGYTFSYFMGAVLLALAAELILSSTLLIRRVRTYETVVRCSRDKTSLVITTNKSNTYRVNTILLVIITVLVGMASGAYGIGGASILSPILIGPMGLPAYIVSGPTLMVTLVVSLIGVLSYAYLGYPPDVINGLSMGLGGMIGIYLGTITQRRLPERHIKLTVAAATAAMGIYTILRVSRI